MFLAEMSLFEIIANATYGALAAVALWGLYCIVVVWTRVAQKRFKNEAEQDAFMDDVEQMMVAGDFEGVAEYCDGDPRAIPQMIELLVAHREHGYKRARQIMMDRYQRDVMSDLEYRLSWVGTVIKSAPMIGLFGTVFGMMGAFQTLATAETVEPAALAGDIQLALVTTASGLAIAIPLIILIANVNIRIAKMEDLVGAGMTRALDAFKSGLANDVGLGRAEDAAAAVMVDAM
jgi:biopolymer transport protein ExbB/TolQ